MYKGTLSGQALKAVLDAEIARTETGIATQLAAYDPVVTPQSWHRVLQGAEELINLGAEPLDDGALHHAIMSMPVAIAIGPKRAWLEQSIRGLFDGGIEARILDVLLLIHAFNIACAANGLHLGLTTIAHATGYLHTRRRRMVSLLYVMPQLCRGTTQACTLVDLMPFMTLLELATGPVVDLPRGHEGVEARKPLILFPLEPAVFHLGGGAWLRFGCRRHQRIVAVEASFRARLASTAGLEPCRDQRISSGRREIKSQSGDRGENPNTQPCLPAHCR